MTPSGANVHVVAAVRRDGSARTQVLAPEKMGRLGLGFGFGCPTSQLGLRFCPIRGRFFFHCVPMFHARSHFSLAGGHR
jgi:hypothetical protein